MKKILRKNKGRKKGVLNFPKETLMATKKFFFNGKS
jgi:hypothetical protein